MKKSITIFSFSILSSIILLYFISLTNLFIFQRKIEDTNYIIILIMQIIVFIFPIFFISKMFLIELKDIIPINLNINIKYLLMMLLCAFIIEFFVNSFQNIIIEILPKFIQIVLEESGKNTLDFYKKILNFDNILQFFIIFFVVAIVPSISEELYFR
jgi:membrane protease YdiL (CAAX protease family)